MFNTDSFFYKKKYNKYEIFYYLILCYLKLKSILNKVHKDVTKHILKSKNNNDQIQSKLKYSVQN